LDVEKWGWQERTIFKDQDQPAPFNDKYPAGPVAGICYKNRLVETGDRLLENKISGLDTGWFRATCACAGPAA
jgi:hypothetical protein